MLQMLFLLALEEDSENTEALIRRIGQDDPDAFARFYQETERALYAYTLSLTKDHHDALDIMQDTYLKVRAAAHLYEPRGKPMAWVFTIAKNLTRDRFRAQSRFQDLDWIGSDQAACARVDTFWSLGGVAHHQYGLAK